MTILLITMAVMAAIGLALIFDAHQKREAWRRRAAMRRAIVAMGELAVVFAALGPPIQQAIRAFDDFGKAWAKFSVSVADSENSSGQTGAQ